MDNLTHALAGAALSKAGLDRTTPLATATLVVAANAPDVDVLSFARGEHFALAFRRGLTHGLPAMVVLPFAVAGAVLAWDRWVRRRRSPRAEPARPAAVLALSFVGALTHPALDWMNVYGIRWWMPFDGRWSYGDALFIVDPWLWLLLGGAAFLGTRWSPRGYAGWAFLAAVASALVLLGPVPGAARVAWLAGLAVTVAAGGVQAWRSARSTASGASGAGPSGARGGPLRHPRPARALGLLAVTYLAAMVAADRVARRDVREAAGGAGLEVVDVMVSPSVADPFAADVELETPDGYVPGSWRWGRTPRVALRPDGRVAKTSRGGPGGATDPDVGSEPVDRVLAVARRDPDVRYWLSWSRYPYVAVVADDDGWTVRWGDARYDDRDGAGALSGITTRVERADLGR